MVKGAAIIINIVFIQNLLKPFCCVFVKTLYSTFLCLGVLASSFKFQSYFYNTKKQKKILHRTALNILTFLEAGQGNCLPYVQRLRHFFASQKNKYRYEMKKYVSLL